MARKKEEKLTPAQERMKAKWEAMQRGKLEMEKANNINLLLMKNLPDYIHVGAEFVETNNGSVGRITRINPTEPSGIYYKVIKLNGEDYEDSSEHSDRPKFMIERVEQGMVIFRGYTPTTLKFGFRFTEVNRAGEVIVTERTTPDSTDKRLMDKYNALKPSWL